MEEKKVKLYGRIFIETDVVALTGLHIGGSSSGLEIGGVDNPVIRDVLTNRPYIPGSSLRGKMRSQLEKSLGLVQNNTIGKGVKIHTCTPDQYEENGGCPVCHIFGVSGKDKASGLTLLLVRDTFLTPESDEELKEAHTDLSYTELKTEVAIDRVTSAASPRNIERVPAGAVFGPAELVFSLYSQEDLRRFRHVLDGLQLVEDDYLGGAGSRGSGKVKFANLRVTFRVSQNYGTPHQYEKEFDTLQQVSDEYEELINWAQALISGE